jgi:hypothetical protein
VRPGGLGTRSSVADKANPIAHSRPPLRLARRYSATGSARRFFSLPRFPVDPGVMKRTLVLEQGRALA